MSRRKRYRGTTDADRDKRDYWGQCVHAWSGDPAGVQTCRAPAVGVPPDPETGERPECGAVCRRDEDGKICYYSADGDVADRRREKTDKPDATASTEVAQ